MDEPSKEKKDELKTYRLLGLSRVPRGKKKREFIEHKGLEKIIGGDTPERPSLRIPQPRYWELREQVYREFLEGVEKVGTLIPLERLLDSAKADLERRIYDLWTRSQESKPEKSPFQGYRHQVLNEVMGKIKSIQKRNPDRYQKIWKEIVGPEFSKESWLHRVDEEKGIAYIRCFNNALGFQISRRPDFARQIGEKLNCRITSIRIG
jgi:hypothetical protein